MRVTKLGHCCLILEDRGVRLITDPGVFSTAQNEVGNIDAVLITHEHADHFHIDSVQAILRNNPQALVITNGAVGKLLEAQGIPYVRVGDGEKTSVKGLPISGHGKDHAIIYETIPNVENTGFYVAESFFFPGDAFFDPKLAVGVLALPVAGPWMKISEALDYARAVKPRACFPVHDAVLNPNISGFIQRMPEQILAGFNISFVPMKEGDAREF